MKKGIIKALLIYIIGFSLAGFVYSIFGHPYIHAPGFHHLIIFLTFIIGIIWTVISIIYYFSKKKSSNFGGFILTNSLIIISFFLYLYIDIKEFNSKQDSFEIPNNTLDVKIKGDSTYMTVNDKIVYLKIKDSVIINEIDDIKFNE